MSDEERQPQSPPPSPPNLRPDSIPTNKPGARNMADIAALFLQGARPIPPSTTPKRIGPHERRNEDRQPAPHPTPEPPQTIPAKAQVRLALALPASQSASWALLSSAAAGLAAERNTHVALLGLQPASNTPGERSLEFVIDVAGPKRIPPMSIGQEAGGGGTAGVGGLRTS